MTELYCSDKEMLEIMQKVINKDTLISPQKACYDIGTILENMSTLTTAEETALRLKSITFNYQLKPLYNPK